MRKLNDLSGLNVGRLKILELAYRKDSVLFWKCICSCGNEIVVRAASLKNGNTKSCGCLKRSILGDKTRTHGRANSRVKGYADRTYGIWQAFRDRCNNKNRKDYKYYGGKGITYDPSWDEFEQFVKDMGEAPEGLTLDRIDGSLGYSKNNCRWASRKMQSHNSSKIRYVELEGISKPLQEWLVHYNINRHLFYNRLRIGWTVEAALTTPKRNQQNG